MSWFVRNSARALSKVNAECAPLVLTRRGQSVAIVLDLDTYAWLERAWRLRERFSPDRL
jgi:PHD/YefM family antitoxin component YafN of YafNO toxin-antitoxin module